MSEENVEVVRRAYEATNRGETEAAYALTHPEIEFHTYVKSPEAGVYRGRDAVRKYNEDLFGQFESLTIDIEELIDAGDHVVVVSTQHAVPKGGGTEEIKVRMVELWTLRDGLLATRRSFESKEQALETAGLQE